MTARTTFGRRAYTFATLGVLAFTLYGSYVPFQYHHRPWNEVSSSFLWAMQNRIGFESRSDGIANWMLGVPLGFSLLGALRADRPNNLTTALLGGILVPVCTLFAALVELGQLYFPARTCAGSDVIAQGFGALCGVLLWVTLGPWFTGQVRKLFEGTDEQTVAIRFCAAYAAFVLLVEWLPLDFTVSPTEMYRRLLRTDGRTTLIPFREMKGRQFRNEAEMWDVIQLWLELAILFLPLGLLLSRLDRWISPARQVLLALGFSCVAEIVQLSLTRYPSTSDAIIGTAAILGGCWLAKALRTERAHAYRTEISLVLLQVWLIAMVLIHWHPFRFAPNRFAARLDDLEWWPLAAQASENYLWALDKVFTKFVLFVPLGILMAWAGKWSFPRKLKFRVVVCSFFIAAALEIGQMMLPGRFGSPTDILFGVAGAWLGTGIAFQAIRASEEKNVLENTGWKPTPSADGARDA